LINGKLAIGHTSTCHLE